MVLHRPVELARLRGQVADATVSNRASVAVLFSSRISILRDRCYYRANVIYLIQAQHWAFCILCRLRLMIEIKLCFDNCLPDFRFCMLCCWLSAQLVCLSFGCARDSGFPNTPTSLRRLHC